MISEKHLELADALFESMADTLFATGSTLQSYAIVNGKKAIVLPINNEVSLGVSVAMDILTSLSEMKEVELSIFLTEGSMLRYDLTEDEEKLLRDNKSTWKETAQEIFSKKEKPQRRKCLMMIAYDPKTQQFDAKIGDIRKDSEGGRYVSNAKWLESATSPAFDVKTLKTSENPYFDA